MLKRFPPVLMNRTVFGSSVNYTEDVHQSTLYQTRTPPIRTHLDRENPKAGGMGIVYEPQTLAIAQIPVCDLKK